MSSHRFMSPTSRRRFLRDAAFAAGVLAVGPRLIGAAFAADGSSAAPLAAAGGDWHYGPLQPANADGLRLPVGFTSRIIARADEPVGDSTYLWHRSPDGGAVFATDDGGWIYVSNSELADGAGGVGAIRFDADGGIVDAYRICEGTSVNCAGGPTPWGTWISCEEIENGRAIECDPFGKKPQRALPALGAFYREAVAIDPVAGHVYHTEDRHDGKLYRTRHPEYPDLSTGVLEAAVVEPGAVRDVRALRWIEVPQPSPGPRDPVTRAQVPTATSFARGEGMWYHGGFVYFTTTADNRVWAIDCAGQTIQAIYDREATDPPGIARGVDNICVAAGGDLLVAEDGGDMQIVLMRPDGRAAPLVQIEHDESEVTGPSFSPDGSRLYFSSQRGPSRHGLHGVTFEVTGPFRDAQTG